MKSTCPHCPHFSGTKSHKFLAAPGAGYLADSLVAQALDLAESDMRDLHRRALTQ